MAYSMDLRRKSVEYKQKGHTFEEPAEAFGIHHDTYYQWKERLENGYYDAKPKQARKGKIDREKLRRAVKDRPDIFPRELAQTFGCAPQAVHAMLRELGITRKKTAHILGGERRGPSAVRGPRKARSAAQTRLP